MPYNAQAESYGRDKTPVTLPPPYATPEGWCLFDQVYSDITDATPVTGPWRASDLLRVLPSISRFAERTQQQILAVVIRDGLTLPAEADRWRRVRGGVYQWVITEGTS